ncbi:MAG: IS4 family transposase [Verrucomicrobiota bacterium]
MPRLSLQAAIRLVARRAGWRGAPSDGQPGAESVEAGLRRLMDLVSGWRLHAQCARRRSARPGSRR